MENCFALSAPGGGFSEQSVKGMLTSADKHLKIYCVLKRQSYVMNGEMKAKM